MSTTKRRINITMSEKTLQAIDSLSSKGDRSRFIADAVSFYIDTQSKEKIRSLLKEGAKEHARRDQDIASEWTLLEHEVWQNQV